MRVDLITLSVVGISGRVSCFKLPNQYQNLNLELRLVFLPYNFSFYP
ncbi:hypothetical protein EW14_1307 [Prochlorococcus sp. MIT 0604]|nr:hypothetical protein EW14_1307 [Prochlorococcus sp. MIT 0604]